MQIDECDQERERKDMARVIAWHKRRATFHWREDRTLKTFIYYANLYKTSSI